MNRDEQEMALWAAEYSASRLICVADRAAAADFAVEQFRKRYPVEPTAPAPTAPELAWYDEPPFLKNGTSYPCWVEGDAVHGDVHWCTGTNEWWVWIVGSAFRHALAGRRVCPIVKPPEPTT